MALNTSSSLVTVGTTPLTVATDNAKRVALLVQVKAGGSVSIKFGSDISIDATGLNDGIDITNFFLIDIHCPTSSVSIVGSAPNTIALIQETLLI